MQNKGFNIVLVHPEIPQNTGNIGRICVCTNTRLHLIKPIGFSLDNTKVKRAGLDYWKHLKLEIHNTWDDFLKNEKPNAMLFATTKAKNNYFDCKFKKSHYLIFGKESDGFPSSFYDKYYQDLYKIPMFGDFTRAHNLANSVSVILYEAIRQVIYKG